MIYRYLRRAAIETAQFISLDARGGLFAISLGLTVFVGRGWILGNQSAIDYALETTVDAVVTGGLFLLVLYFANLLRSPFLIIKEQDGIISSLEAIADRKNIIARLYDLWTDGTNLRNRGESLMHPDRVEVWWQEHLDWRNTSRDLMALLDANMARKWWTLGLYTPTRRIGLAWNSLHEKRIQMFDAWLERLLENIQILEEGKK